MVVCELNHRAGPAGGFFVGPPGRGADAAAGAAGSGAR
jgi:hypothetical protein